VQPVPPSVIDTGAMPGAAGFLCRDDELAEGESRGFDPWREGQDTVLLVRHGGEVYGWVDACPHHGGTPMAWRKDAYLNHDSTRIVCAAHGAQFDIASGVCVLGPCLGQSLQRVGLAITRDRNIYIRPSGEEETKHDSPSNQRSK
jgi:nitrite reductase/ring-hydroxylating ferredoxin subunit